MAYVRNGRAERQDQLTMPQTKLVVLEVEALRTLVIEAIKQALSIASPNQEEVLTLEGAAELLKMHPKVVAKYVKKGLPAAKIGREYRFRRSALLDWIDRQTSRGGRGANDG